MTKLLVIVSALLMGAVSGACEVHRQLGLLEEMGLEAGDQIVSVNGKQIDGVDQAHAAYGQLKASDSMDVVIVRGGKKKKLSLKVR